MRKIPLLISFFISLGLLSHGQLTTGDYIEVTSYNHYKYNRYINSFVIIMFRNSFACITKRQKSETPAF